MDYKQTLQDAQERLKVLIVQRDLLDREIEALMRIVEGAQIGAQDPSHWDPDNPAWVPKKLNETEPQGVTDSIRKVLRRANRPLVPTEIRDALETIGIEGSSPKNLLIHVHKALGRLFDGGEIGQVPRDGKMAYRWLSAMERQMRDMIEATSDAVRMNVPTGPPTSTRSTPSVPMGPPTDLADPNHPLVKSGMRPQKK